MAEADPYIRLKYSWDQVFRIEDFINCINLHKKDLKSPLNIDLMEFMRDFKGRADFNPAVILRDYIYLEANSFFEYAKNLKAKGDKNMPEPPGYLEELKKFRDEIVGHRDKKHLREFPSGWRELQEKTAKLIPIQQLLKDMNDYYKEVKKRYASTKLSK